MLEQLKTFFGRRKFLFAGIILIGTLFTLDIYTKRLAFSQVEYIQQKTAGVHSHIYINDYLNIVKVVNTGISFGMFRHLQNGQLILSAITLAIILFVFYLLYKTRITYRMFTYSLIIAGGLGNIYDRILFGGVFDFLDFHYKQYHWPAFNIADSIICIGVFLLVFEDLIFMLIRKNNI
ncbi:MAG TPA: signal peptidase II [Rickettsiales bacterium]|nr:signal peptidase II [Rickettsiales bacterium]